MPRMIVLSLLLLAVGCSTRGMGETCSSTNACTGDGVCLKGVCSGYACSNDAECSNGLVCGSVLGAQSCVLECDDDDACDGEQSCTEVQRGLDDEQATALYCM